MSRSRFVIPRTVSLVGLMGAGKSRVGLELARKLKLPFVDSDREIEAASGVTVGEFFARYGEEAFREGEYKVIDRLLKGEKKVLSTGGGAFTVPQTREILLSRSITVWLKADLETLLERTGRVENRPLLQGPDKAEVIERLINERYPIYGQAAITVETGDFTPQQMATKIIHELERFAS